MSNALFDGGSRAGMFPDPDNVKQTVRASLIKPQYDVADFYWEEGIYPRIAKHQIFEYCTLFVISVNALWIAIDTDNNTAGTLVEATPVFIVADNLFCIYFSFEWFVRFMSFRFKRNCLRDSWFVFDSILVFLMVMETWVLTAYILLTGAGGNPVGNASILRLLRLLRLSRLTKLLRSMPELLILVKGMASALRSVFYTMLLLIIVLYVFAIAFTQLNTGTEVGEEYFPGILGSMLTLLLHGTFLDNLSAVVMDVAGGRNAQFDGGQFYHGVMFFVFIAIAALMVMNMLIGVLCEVVSTVAAAEKEEITVQFVHDKLLTVIQEIDDNGDGLVSKAEFSKILTYPEAIHALVEVGVDPVGLVDFAEFIFTDTSEEREGEDMNLTFEQFMNVVLSLRGSNTATVKDIIDMTKTMRVEFRRLETRLGAKMMRKPTNKDKDKDVQCSVVPAVSNVPTPGKAQNTDVETISVQQSIRVPPVRESAANTGRSWEPTDEQEIHVLLNAGLREIRKLKNSGLPGHCSDKSERLIAWAARMDTVIADGLESLKRIQESEAPCS